MCAIVGLGSVDERLVYRKGNGFAFMTQEDTAPPGLLHFQGSANNGRVLLPTEALRPDQLHEPKPQRQLTAADTQPCLYGRIVQINGGDMIIVTDCTVC